MAAKTIALLVLVVAAAAAQEVCVEKSEGMLFGIQFVMYPHILPAGQHKYEIELNSPCQISTVGVKVRVCDPDGPPAPELTLTSHHASVYRYKSRSPATLTATFYCSLADTDKSKQQAWRQ